MIDHTQTGRQGGIQREDGRKTDDLRHIRNAMEKLFQSPSSRRSSCLYPNRRWRSWLAVEATALVTTSGMVTISLRASLLAAAQRNS
jgi:hypothetical protein